MAISRKRKYSGKASKPYKKRRKVYKPRRRYRRPRTYVQRQILNMSETKYTVNSVTPFIELYHNKGNSNGANVISGLLRSTQGNTQFTRIGDKVYAKGLSMKLAFYAGVNNPQMRYRIMICSGQRDDTTAAAPPGFWRNESGNRMLDTVNVDRYKILYHKMIYIKPGDMSIESGATQLDNMKIHKFYVPLNRQVKYLPDGSVQTQYDQDNMFLVVVPFRNSTDVDTLAVASLEVVWKLYFKDM